MNRLPLLVAALLGSVALIAALPAVGTPRPRTTAALQSDDEGPTATLKLALSRAARELDQGNMAGAFRQIERALERDAKSIEAWSLRVRWAAETENRDEQVWSLYRRLIIAEALGRPEEEVEAFRAELLAVDPLALDLNALRETFLEELGPIAEKYEQEGRPHAAIAVHKEILAVDTERAESLEAISRLANAPDPSLAAFAKPKDPLADVSKEWILEHDEEHYEWKDRAKLERDNYVTQTNAGYAVLVRSAEAMEQMNAFYRQFFRYGTDEHKGSVSRITVNIFKNREEYLKKGIGPPTEWSGGHFTGDAVELFIDSGGFEGATGTLFHEAAHQFVSLATQASGWLNEGLASFFEGCRILSNGTVLMNLPANHRLFPLATRMENGWMTGPDDGIDPDNANATPETAPTFNIIIENRYEWGPPWYAPTWGVVYFLYNYQDPVDGRYIYRSSFQDFMDKSGSRTGSGAIKNFEEVVLANPAKPTPGVEFPDEGGIALPQTVDELNPVWRDWILALRDEQSGRTSSEKPWRDWALYAERRKDYDVAFEHYEKGLIATPNDIDLLENFADFLSEQRDEDDRAARLQLQAIRFLEAEEAIDATRLKAAYTNLETYDPLREDVGDVHEEIFAAATTLVQRYLSDAQPSMAMELSAKLGSELRVPGMFDLYAQALEMKGSSLARWQIAYNERDLRGWASGGATNWTPNSERLEAKLGRYVQDKFDFNFLTLDEITSGDFSLEAQVEANTGESAFAGLVFGRKNATNFHALLMFPPKVDLAEGAANSAFLDLTSFYGANNFETWRHAPVGLGADADEGSVVAGGFHTLRIDVVGSKADAWLDGKFVATQDFGDANALRGSFGLIVGPGSATFRDVRYLARDSYDPASALERDRRIEDLMAAGAGLNGSFQGYVPPFPTVERWFGDEVTSWDDFGPKPVLMAFWSINQNELIPIDDWLRDLESKYAAQGLQILSVCSPEDKDNIESYLEDHEFPGSVALDARESFGLGETFDQYALDRFNLPRLILFDIDHRVIWEGDPGFSIGSGYTRGKPTYLDDPLNGLIARRRLGELYPWVESWRADGATALAEGRFADALPLLQQAADLAGVPHPDVVDARARLEAVDLAITARQVTAESLTREGAEPAFAVLLDWGAALGVELDRKEKKALKPILDAPSVDAWETAVKRVAALKKLAKKNKADVSAAELATELRALEGSLPAKLADALDAGEFDGDEGVDWEQLADATEVFAERYLARDYFRWN